MWISRREYTFLKENAEKNIDAECEILEIKDQSTRIAARVLEEYSNVLKDCDELRLRVAELEQQLIKDKDDATNAINIPDLIKFLTLEKYNTIDENSEAMTETFEKEHQWELSRNIFINKVIKYLEMVLNSQSQNK